MAVESETPEVHAARRTALELLLADLGGRAARRPSPDGAAGGRRGRRAGGPRRGVVPRALGSRRHGVRAGREGGGPPPACVRGGGAAGGGAGPGDRRPPGAGGGDPVPDGGGEPAGRRRPALGARRGGDRRSRGCGGLRAAGVFFAGDAVRPTDDPVRAMASGRDAARALEAYVSGRDAGCADRPFTTTVGRLGRKRWRFTFGARRTGRPSEAPGSRRGTARPRRSKAKAGGVSCAPAGRSTPAGSNTTARCSARTRSGSE